MFKYADLNKSIEWENWDYIRSVLKNSFILAVR